MSNQSTVQGTVEESLPNSLFRVKLGDDREILAYISGKMKHHHIRVLPGDRVEVVLDPYKGKTTNRIVERL